MSSHDSPNQYIPISGSLGFCWLRWSNRKSQDRRGQSLYRVYFAAIAFAIGYTCMMQLLPCKWFTKGKYLLGMTMIVRVSNFRACMINIFSMHVVANMMAISICGPFHTNHCNLVMQCSNTDLGLLWLRLWLVPMLINHQLGLLAFKGKFQHIYPWYQFANLWFKLKTVSPKGQWVNSKQHGHKKCIAKVYDI